jgi:flagellar basal-body rod protein FlgB
MTLDLAITRLAEQLASYAATRQGVIAQNIANADTPGYRARDLPPFAEVFADMAQTPAAPLARTRPGHFDLDAEPSRDFGARETAAPGALSPNGNSVSLEDQMMRSAELKLQHDMAIGVYTKSLQILRLGLGH